ncbi:MAG: hypothetical protein Q4E35_10255 [Eubacteriales bacterium]|nr:hypothetical protein [Eubacteriales bacterium]
MKNDDWKQDLYRYRLTPAPPKKDDFQDYIDLYFAEKDEKYLSWFLHYYEPTLNTQMMTAVQEYSMRGHFVDMKQAAVFGILKALANYDISLGVPFLVYKEYYVKNEIDEYIRTMRTGYTVQSSDEYKLLRKTMALYNKYGKSDDETISRIAAEIGKSVKDTREIITAGLRNMSYAEFYRQYADEDGESSAEDVTRDDTTDPAKMFFDEWRADAVFDRYEKLDIRECSMIADHLGFCRECHGVLENGTGENGESVLMFRQKKAYADLALQHTLSSPDTAYRIVHKAYDKILVDLAADEYIHIVELRRKKKTKTEIVYEYCADHNNDWGEIYYTPGDDDYDVTRYVYADKKGGFFFAAAGDWIVRQAIKEQFPQTAVIPITKI